MILNHLFPVNALAFSPDGKTLASGAGNAFASDGPGEIHLWDPLTGIEIASFKCRDVAGLAFTPDGQTLVSGGGVPLRPESGGEVRIWDLATRQARPFPYYGPTVSSVAVSAGGNLLALGCYDQKLKVWDLSSKKEIATLDGHRDRFNAVAFSPDGKTLASGSADETVMLWSVKFSEK